MLYYNISCFNCDRKLSNFAQQQGLGNRQSYEMDGFL